MVGKPEEGTADQNRPEWITKLGCGTTPTLEGEPWMVGRGLLCISSLSLGEE